MRIRREYKMHKAVATDHREILKHVLIGHIDNLPQALSGSTDESLKMWDEIMTWAGYRNVDFSDRSKGLAVATDGFFLVMAPVELGLYDEPGLLQARAFYAKYQLGNRKKFEIDMQPWTIKAPEYDGEIEAVRAGRTWIPRTEALDGDAFPDFIPVVHEAVFMEGVPEAHFNVSLMRRVHEATGITAGEFKIHPTKPSLITPLGTAKLPLACIMPMHAGRTNRK